MLWSSVSSALKQQQHAAASRARLRARGDERNPELAHDLFVRLHNETFELKMLECSDANEVQTRWIVYMEGGLERCLGLGLTSAQGVRVLRLMAQQLAAANTARERHPGASVEPPSWDWGVPDERLASALQSYHWAPHNMLSSPLSCRPIYCVRSPLVSGDLIPVWGSVA